MFSWFKKKKDVPKEKVTEDVGKLTITITLDDGSEHKNSFEGSWLKEYGRWVVYNAYRAYNDWLQDCKETGFYDVDEPCSLDIPLHRIKQISFDEKEYLVECPE